MLLTGTHELGEVEQLMKKFKDVDSYILNSEPEAPLIMEELRKIIRATIPQAEEKIWYGVLFYDYHGELAGFASYKNHVSFGIGAAALKSKDRKMLEEQGYKTAKGTIQIKFGQRAPAAAIKQITKIKAGMNEEKTPTE
jgi:uncharacterized protein